MPRPHKIIYRLKTMGIIKRKIYGFSIKILSFLLIFFLAIEENKDLSQT
jgi:hypothetical protein